MFIPRRLTFVATSVVYRSTSAWVCSRGGRMAPAGACPGCSAFTGRLASSSRTKMSGSSSS
eukprot:3938526-Alexandrium_andersonii.AAC.1